MTKLYSTEHYTGGVDPNPVMALMEYLFLQHSPHAVSMNAVIKVRVIELYSYI